ncbi:MAG: c-type cytochrome [Myxococcales bacterium]|nr:c-type cytochrome [Myxococcales bacterium]
MTLNVLQWIFDVYSQLPESRSTGAKDVDFAFAANYWISFVFFVAIVGTMLVFVYKYRRSRGAVAEPTGHHTKLEIFWTFAPVLLLAWLFYIGFDGYMKSSVAPANPTEVRVTAKRWSWEFKHMPSGASEPHQLVVPAGKPVQLVMSSVDVIHSFFVPNFRVKRDVVPGMYTTIWFETDRPTRLDKDCDIEKFEKSQGHDCGPEATCVAEFRRTVTPNPEKGKDDVRIDRVGVCHRAHQVYCAEYCGAGNTPEDPTKEFYYNHSSMYAQVAVLTPEDYDAHVQNLYEYGLQPPPECQGEDNPVACWGSKIFASKACGACHSVDGSAGQGPTFKGVWGRTEALADGTSVKIEGIDGENYMRESILNPSAKVVSGYNPVMPAFAGILGDAEIDALIAYMKSMGSEP